MRQVRRKPDFFPNRLTAKFISGRTKRYADGKKFSQPCKTAFGNAV